MLVAIDGSPHSSRALAEAADLAERNNATLTVMACVPDPAGWLLGGTYASGVDFEALAKETEEEYGNLLRDVVDALPQNLSVIKVLRHGRPAEQILEQLNAGNHDLTVSPAAVLIVHAEVDDG
jgi:nucleotide-binding universal stress UspA family protein